MWFSSGPKGNTSFCGTQATAKMLKNDYLGLQHASPYILLETRFESLAFLQHDIIYRREVSGKEKKKSTKKQRSQHTLKKSLKTFLKAISIYSSLTHFSINGPNQLPKKSHSYIKYITTNLQSERKAQNYYSFCFSIRLNPSSFQIVVHVAYLTSFEISVHFKNCYKDVSSELPYTSISFKTAEELYFQASYSQLASLNSILTLLST